MKIPEGFTIHDLIENFTISRIKWAVYIDDDDFSLERGIEWQVDLNSLFGNRVGTSIAASVISDEVVTFDSELQAWELFNLMNNHYHDVYTGLFGPEGMITENT
jgi:hypothetical protein